LLFASAAFSEDSPGTEIDIALLCQLAFSHLSCHQPKFVCSASRSASAPVCGSGTAFSAGSRGSLLVTRPNWRWLHEDCPHPEWDREHQQQPLQTGVDGACRREDGAEGIAPSSATCEQLSLWRRHGEK